jgi:DNA-binding beta-propeller fold protein YncE
LRLKATAIAFLACAAVVVTAAPASAQWRPVVRDCESTSAVTDCSSTTPLNGAWNLVVSPDGRTAYVAGLKTGGNAGTGAIHVYTRNPGTGALTLKPGADGCITFAAVPGCAQARAIGRPDEIMFSQDGRFVYVSSEEDVTALPNALAGAVAVFKRNTTTGVLEQLPGLQGCINDDGSETCTDGHSIGGRGAVLSADQRNIYVLGNESLAVLKRNTTDGTLSQAATDCFGVSTMNANCTDLTPRPTGRQLAIASDGTRVFTPASGGLRSFSRNTTTGALAPAGCITQTGSNGCARLPQIGLLPQNLVLSPDNKHLYLSHRDGIVTFGKNPNGSLAFLSCINDAGTLGCANSSNVANLTYMAASPDGQDIVAVPQGSPGGLSAFARNGSTGALTRRPGRDGCITPDGSGFDNGTGVAGACRTDARVSFFGHVHFAGDAQILAGFFGGDRVVVIKRDFYALCQSRTIRVRRNRAKTIPLACADRNGDAITRSIIDQPNAGTLGAINQIAGTVVYDPFSNFSGSDRFTFHATSAGLTGPPAIVNIQFPKPKPTKIRGVALAFTFSAFSDHTVLGTLVVKGVPRRGKVRAVCTLHGHRCAGKAGKRFSKRGRGSVSLSRRYAGVDLKVGSRIAIALTKRGKIGVGKLFTIRSRKAPRVVSRCLRPGSNKLRKRC